MREHEAPSVRCPAEARDVEVARREPHRPRGFVRLGIDGDDVQVGELVVPVHEDDIPLFLPRLLLLRGRRVPHEEGDPRPVGRPPVAPHRALRLRQLSRLAARHRQRPQLAARLALALSAGGEAQPGTIRRELRRARRCLSPRPLRGPRSLGVGHPDVTQVLGLRSFHQRLAHDEGDTGAVRGDRGAGNGAILHAQGRRPPGVVLGGGCGHSGGGRHDERRGEREGPPRGADEEGLGQNVPGPGHDHTSRFTWRRCVLAHRTTRPT